MSFTTKSTLQSLRVARAPFLFLAHHHTNHFACLFTLCDALDAKRRIRYTCYRLSDRKGNFEEQVILVVQMTFLIRNIMQVTRKNILLPKFDIYLFKFVFHANGCLVNDESRGQTNYTSLH